MIIDAYTHILPKKYQTSLEKKVNDRDATLNSVRYARTIPTLVDLAHGLKGVAYSMGAEPLAEAARTLEDSARRADLEASRIGLDHVAEVVVKVGDELEKLVG